MADERDFSQRAVAQEATGSQTEGPITAENAKEKGRAGGLKSAEVRRLKREDPEAYMRRQAEQALPDLMADLINAAKGAGRWHDLPLEKQLDALKRALEYAVGRPRAAEKPSTDEPEKPRPGFEVE
jgi:hypothetical protein